MLADAERAEVRRLTRITRADVAVNVAVLLALLILWGPVVWWLAR